jgi:predicted aconitase with swiveling domain
MRGRVLVAGTAHGRLLRLERPLSFWGGIDPASGRVIAPGHPQEGQSISDRIIALERSIGSSSGSSILLELLAQGRGPRGIILAEADAILTLGALVGREMGFAEVPVVWLSRDEFPGLPTRLTIEADGRLSAGTVTP